jgi:hypothetical protein
MIFEFNRHFSNYSGHKHSIKIAHSLAIIVLLSACNGAAPANDQQDGESTAIVAATRTAGVSTETPTQPPTQTDRPSMAATATSAPTATPSPTATFTPTPTIPANNVTGDICFPGEEIPEMTIYLEDTEKETVVELPVAAGQTNYEANLAAGTYIAYAWLKDFSLGGLYSRAVPCGLKSECEDHTLLSFTVVRTEVTEGIDICDWSAGPFNVPYPPGVERADLTGNVSGNLTYIEDEDIPGLRVVAFNQRTNYWYWVYTQPGQTTYSLTELPPGTYHLVAYDSEGRAGGYADAHHNLLDVTVKSGATSGEINITDWNAPRTAFPPDPTR